MESEKELWGHKFKIVKDGLDEAEVYSFVDSLTNQYANFSKRLEHLDSLVARLTEHYTDLSAKLGHGSTPGDLDAAYADHASTSSTPRYSDSLFNPSNGHLTEADAERLENIASLTTFAERTIIEAAKQSRSIKVEIEEKARARAAEIIARAHDDAREEARRILIEAEAGAAQSAETIIAAAQEKAQDLLQNGGPSLEALNTATAHESEALEAAVHEAQNELQAFVKHSKEKADESAQAVKQASRQLLKKRDSLAEEDIKEAFEKIQQSLRSLMEHFEQMPAISIQTPPPEPATSETEAAEQAGDQASPGSTEQRPLVDSGLFEGTVELALTPPVLLDKMLLLHKHLKQTPNVDVLNLGGSVDKGITIRVLVETPTPLVEVIGSLSELGEAFEELPSDEKLVPTRQNGEDQPIRRIVIATEKR
jgi:vacuolar-type H+-ATPase subunit H